MDNSKTYIYSNAAGDSISTTSISETLSNEREVQLYSFPQGTVGEKFTQIVKVDTLFDYTTVLISEFSNYVRSDVVIIVALGFTMYGGAEPDYSIGIMGTFTDSLNLNGITYTSVYSQTTTSQNTSLFVNVENGLVGFTIEKDTFNLVN